MGIQVSIAQWLEHQPSDPAVVRLSPGQGPTYMFGIVLSLSLYS